MSSEAYAVKTEKFVRIKLPGLTDLNLKQLPNRQPVLAPYGEPTASDTYFTSDYDLSKFHSQFFGGNLRIVLPNGIPGIQHFSSAELRVGHNLRSED